jgi:proteic killer suppression protein
MRYVFTDTKLRTLYTTGKGRFALAAIAGFFRVMGHIDQAADERDLYALKGLRYEKLKGDRQGQHSLRLNKQFRLIVESANDEAGRFLKIVEIVDYH